MEKLIGTSTKKNKIQYWMLSRKKWENKYQRGKETNNDPCVYKKVIPTNK